MPEPKWAIRGEYMESCNCDYLCPCIYTNPQGQVTHDDCTAIMAFRVDEGNFEGTRLDGGKFALVIRSGKVMADGNWVFGVVVDAAAEEAQRRALAAIAGGESGGPPAMIRQNLVSDWRGVEFRAIEFAMNGLERRAAIAGVAEFHIAGVASRNRSGDPYYIDNVGHPASRRLALAQARELHVHGFGLDLDMSGVGNNGHFAPFRWSA